MNDYTVLLAGNPNVGKSTLFNALTGLHQHTGNWSGKTVENAVGEFHLDSGRYRLIDLPGTYSLSPASREEWVAVETICHTPANAVIVVGDATAPARGIAMARQIAEVRGSVLLCLNLADEAEHRGIKLDREGVERAIGIPVVLITARKREGFAELFGRLEHLCENPTKSVPISYGDADSLIAKLEHLLAPACNGVCSPRYVAGRIYEDDLSALADLQERLGLTAELLLTADEILQEKSSEERGLSERLLQESIEIAEQYTCGGGDLPRTTRFLDRLFLGKAGIPLLLLLISFLLWISLVGANYPSQWLSSFFAMTEGHLRPWTAFLSAFWDGLIWEGGWRVLTWVVAVMLPPMAIFFPLFTLLEDFGLLPRIAFLLDAPFAVAGTTGKQALPMCMSLGCNCTGVVGTRIIEDSRERKIAIATAGFIPCNGRFPTLLCLVSLFAGGGRFRGIVELMWLFLLLFFSVSVTLFCTWLLGKTFYRGERSTLVLELPLYRPPQVGRVLLRSLLDRTLRVLLRAMAAAAPAGCIIWLLANIRLGGVTPLGVLVDFLHPLGSLLGLDGSILTAFLLGLPANEIVLPILLMCYSNGGSLIAAEGAALLGALQAAGWNGLTALLVGIFCICHFPCFTALATVHKETGDRRLVMLSAMLPTIIGMLLCLLIYQTVKILF